MGNVAIRVEGLGKMYRIGGRQERYRTLRDTLTDAFTAPFRRASSLLHGQAYGAANLNETIWALKDVSFEVKHGEVVGIIGRNGAGKSTLLKILSRITEPTEGYADVYGRVGSLLEVGTGFHPELTGRENIYLNGAILGMSRAEIDRKFDEIVAFAEIEKFIDTPVKHYSSGMGLRLGFAVAAHLEPEILVVDEVLAVGDAQFQKKCLGKMSEVAGEGRTVLFVSHNMAAVLNLCDRVAVLDRGNVRYLGEANEGVARYVNNMIAQSDGDVDLRMHSARRKGCTPILQRARLLGEDGNVRSQFLSGESWRIEMSCFLDAPLQDFQIGIGVDDWFQSRVFSLTTLTAGAKLAPATHTFKVVCVVDDLPLAPGHYTLSLSAGTSHAPLLDALDHAVTFYVEASDFFGSGKLPSANLGRVLVRSKWSLEE
ncbi:MAG: ABC transporter ATP-binding protein [Chloroflexota bacterium]|jgi:lipopolysaccharide transport system ATP-binding protein